VLVIGAGSPSGHCPRRRYEGFSWRWWRRTTLPPGPPPVVAADPRGLRYLEHGVRLVRESLRERGSCACSLRTCAARPDVHAGRRPAAGGVTGRAGGVRGAGAGRNIALPGVSAADVREAIPGSAAVARFRYWEGQADDARLTIEVARAAHACGAVLANHARWTGCSAGPGGGRGPWSTSDRAAIEIRARVIVNAAGVGGPHQRLAAAVAAAPDGGGSGWCE